jgi:hypothetical protein
LKFVSTKIKIKFAPENSILKFPTVSSMSSDSIVKGIIDDIFKTAVKTAEVDEQKNEKKHLKMMGICIFPLHCCTLYFRKDCLHVHV